MNNSGGKIFAVSAPSGAGKSTIVKQILKTYPQIIFSVSATTRKKRNDEVDGREYFFISEDEFKKKIENDEFVEWEKFYDYYYGTLKSFINKNIQSGKSVIMEVDVNGALSIKKLYPDATLVFIAPPTFEELVNRLKNRNTETEEDLKKRIERAEMELSLKDKFDYFVINNHLETAILEVKRIIENKLKENIDAN
ncbi:MAG: guanylate kinase [Ignavibacteriales bacterium]|nr:guanylate kinase [Ignavibacteriales bacterium]